MSLFFLIICVHIVVKNWCQVLEVCSENDIFVQAFYYVWYGNPEMDGEYIHWNHAILPHWNAETNNRYSIGEKYKPDTGDIGSVFYPMRGLYSSRDKKIVEDQFKVLQGIGVNAIVLSYWGRGRADGDGKHFPDRIFRIFEVAESVGMKVAIHVEPFWTEEKGNDEMKIDLIRSEIEYLLKNFGNSSSLLRVPITSQNADQIKSLPLIYLYDSYLLPSDQWRRILDPSSPETIRGTELDGIFVGLYLNPSQSESHILSSHFDGFYSYFASNGFTFGSNPKNWKKLNSWAEEHNLYFIPSVGPGYDDTKIRPWNGGNTKSRETGNYYRRMFDEAVKIFFDSANDGKKFISITSFNEWGEGTQIEECVQFNHEGSEYQNYETSPRMYLEITEEYVNKLKKY